MSTNGLDLLNKIFYSAGEGIVIVNEKGEIALVNQRSQEIFDYTSEELIGRSIEFLVPTEIRKKHVDLRESFLEKPSARPMGVGRDLEGVKKSGERFPLEISLSYITHERNKYVVAFINDITIRKRNENALEESREKLQKHAGDLEAKVKERTRELEHLNMGLRSQIRERKIAEDALRKSLDDLKKAEEEILKSLEYEKQLNELKSRFVSMASHEFRTPLTTILSSANLIGKYKEGEQQDKREKHIQRIQTSVNNLTNILNDFLSLDKLESDGISVNWTSIDLRDFLSEVVENIEPSLKKDQFISIKTNPETVTSDIHILQNVMVNLLSNASKYSNEGDEIKVDVTKKGNNLDIEVIDQGIGIPEEEQKKLFQRFFRAENATNIQGTGLGLNIVKKYMDLIKGTINFSSKEGQGSTFTITLPTTLAK